MVIVFAVLPYGGTATELWARITPEAKNCYPRNIQSAFWTHMPCSLHPAKQLVVTGPAVSSLALRLEGLHQPFVLHFGHVRKFVDRIGPLRACCEGLLPPHVGRDFAHG